MNPRVLGLAVVFAILSINEPATAQSDNPTRDILVTFDNQGARARSTGVSAPYRNRKRYAIAASARRDADDVRDEFSLLEVDHWPIRSLSIYCFVYRIPAAADRDSIIARLQADERIESVQSLQEFETGISSMANYDDTYADLQHGLGILDVDAAHRISQGHGIRIAIIDGDADARHEDLRGQFSKVRKFTGDGVKENVAHGTAVASIIGANANNAKGIVGIAPEASLELFVSCWAHKELNKAICDTFTLAKALDTLLDDPPDVLNMSLTGPYDPLLERLLDTAQAAGVVIVSARSAEPGTQNHFPASLETVIDVGNSATGDSAGRASTLNDNIYAPGNQIMVAVPDDAYDFRSGSSLAAAHVSGAVALLLSVSPDLPFASVQAYLRESQNSGTSDTVSINACVILKLADNSRSCP